jgi:hypothetical protein
MNKLIEFKTNKTTMYINTDYIMTMNKLDYPISEGGEDLCTYGIVLVSGMKFAIPTSCFEDICNVFRENSPSSR